MMEKPFQVCYSRVMKDGYFAQDNGSSTQIEKLLEILIEQNEKQSEQIEKQSELIEKLYDQIEKLNNQIEQKDEIIRKLQKMLFGRKSEKAAALEMMANMEPLFTMDYPEPKQEERTRTVKAHERRRCPNRTDDLDSLPHEKVVIEATEEEKKCPYCGEEMIKVGEEKAHTIVKVIPAQIIIEDIYTETYACPACMNDGEGVLYKTDAPAALIPGSFASAQALAYVANERFVKGVTYYRQEKEWKSWKLPVSRRTMSNWVMLGSESYFEPLIERMKSHLLKEEYIHCDETTIQVMKEEGRRNTNKSYMWVYSSIQESEHPMRLFDYEPGRGGKYAADYLEGFAGILITDDYAGYNQVDHDERALCWAHARRYFVDALEGLKEAAGSVSVKILTQIMKIFRIEAKLQKLKPKERKEERMLREGGLVEQVFVCAKTALATEGWTTQKEKQALNYLVDNEEGLKIYLKDGNVPMTNSLSERTIRSFAIGRRNWLFSGSPRGARSCGVLYSVVESAKANGLVPYKYILYVLEKLRGKIGQLSDEILDQMMPWNAEVKEQCV